jgi:glycosyltransferase involved in cell wall biosynthesis
MSTSNHQSANGKIKSIAVIGNYLPRQCGIATFTSDLVASILAADQHCQCMTVAMNDRPEGYNYPDEVRFEINDDDPDCYYAAANYLNIHRPDVVCLQHEFGIFGGTAGNYILTLLEELQMPVVTTLHTVLAQPLNKQKLVMKRLAELSQRLVVMSKSAIHMLNTIYDIPEEKIAYIPHGIPDRPFMDCSYYKEKFNLLGKNVLLTFGLLSAGKGIDYVIKGLPKVVKQIPELKYIVVGATHPNVLASEGEKYRRMLEHQVQELGLEDHVVFVNNFVSQEELYDYLAAADLYITPYNNKNQITSGTLAYAMGFGKAVISTPYWYAKEMLADERGQLVPFKDAEAIADAVIRLFSDDMARHKTCKRAYDFNRHATWKEVARQYLGLFEQVKSDHCRYHVTSTLHSNLRYLDSDLQYLQSEDTFMEEKELPLPKFDHLFRLTDECGLLQHANYTIPDRSHGYCTDDNARALIVTLRAQNLSLISEINEAKLEDLSVRYLGFLKYAYNPESQRFRNFMDYSRQWLEPTGSEDAHSRALWALGTAVALSEQNARLSLIITLFMRALKTAESFHSPRSIAFALVGMYSYLEAFGGDSHVQRAAKVLAERLFHQFSTNAGDNWLWPENILAYSNGKLPHALILAGNMLQDDDMMQMGLHTLDWLLDIQTEDGHLSPIGNHGWFNRDEEKARFDQQPVEVNALLEACIAAYSLTNNSKQNWLDKARMCFNWFLGSNDLNLPLYDSQSGGCHDGLQINRVNQNQGAESTLAWLLSLTAIHGLSDEEIQQVNYNGHSINH